MKVGGPSTCHCLKITAHDSSLLLTDWSGLCVYTVAPPHVVQPCPLSRNGFCWTVKRLFQNSVKVWNVWHFTFSDRMLNETLILRILSRFYGLNGFGKAFWLDWNLVFWVSQATAAIHRTDSNGVATKRDHANTCAHTGTKLPADQTEPLQQPNHNTLWLSQVRHPTTGMFNSATYCMWHIHVFMMLCKDFLSLLNLHLFPKLAHLYSWEFSKWSLRTDGFRVFRQVFSRVWRFWLLLVPY